MSSFAEKQLEILLNMASFKQLFILAYNKLYDGCNAHDAEYVFRKQVIPNLVESRMNEIRKELTDSLLNE